VVLRLSTTVMRVRICTRRKMHQVYVSRARPASRKQVAPLLPAHFHGARGCSRMTCSFEDTFWSLPFAIGWITTRDALSSLSFFDVSSPAWREWRSAELSAGLGLAFAKPEDETAPAWGAIKQALIEGRIVATGRPDGGPREPVPALSWIDAVSPLAGPPSHAAVMLARKDVIRLWPAGGLEEQRKRRGPQSGKTDRLAETILAELRAGEFRPDKDSVQAKRYGVSRDTLVKARTKALSEFSAEN